MFVALLAALAAANATPACPAPPDARAADFGGPIDNPYFPLKPGTTFRYRGFDGEDPSTDVFTVTHRTKMIAGVKTTVIHDRGFVNGKLSENTRDWYAQDRTGNVWYFGEATRQIKHGKVAGREGSWQAGRRGARPGIFMPAHPKVGNVFRQEDAQGVAEDCFEVVDRHAQTTSPEVTTADGLKTREFTALEPGVIDAKYYVRGIGTARDVNVKPGDEKLELVSVTHR